MADVKAVICDENWFQVYDNKSQFTEDYVAAGLYWNYFYHQWKTISSSPFANAVVFVTDTATTTLPDTITAEITDKSVSEEAITLTLKASADGATLAPNNVNFVQTEALTTAGIAVHPFGALLIPASQVATTIKLVATINGTEYTGATNITSASDVGASVTLNKG